MGRATKKEMEARWTSKCCGAPIVLGSGAQCWCTACFEDVPTPLSEQQELKLRLSDPFYDGEDAEFFRSLSLAKRAWPTNVAKRHAFYAFHGLENEVNPLE